MKRNLFSKALALGLAGTMLFSTSVWATEPVTKGDISGAATVTSPVYLVTVPANSNFTIDPLKIGADVETQIYSEPLLIVNKSNIPVEMNLTVTPKLGSAVTITNEDAVLAASAVLTTTTKLLSMYVAPATKTTLAAAGDVLTTADGDNKYALPTRYIGVGTTNAAFTTVLGASENYTTTWAAPSVLADAPTATAFVIKGSVNKNAAWAVADVTLTVSYQFSGVDADSYTTNYSYISPYLNITKATSGTGAVVLTPRFRNKVEVISGTPSGAFTLTSVIELGATAAAAWKTYAADSANSANAAAGTGFVVSAITATKDGVSSTTLFPTTSLATDFTVTVAIADDEKGLIATVKINDDAAKRLIEGSTYEIKTITLKLGSATTTYAAAANAGMTIMVNETP